MVVYKYVNGKVNVKFYNTHIGHKCEIGRTNLNADQRKQISGIYL